MDGIPWKVPESIGVPGPGYVSGNPNYTSKKFEKLIGSYFLVMDEIPSKVPESIGVPAPGYVWGNPNYTLRIFEKLIVSWFFLLWMGFPQKYLSP